MKRVRPVLLCILALAATCPPAALGEPLEAAAGAATVLELGEPLAIQVAAAFAIGVVLGVVRIVRRRRRDAVAPEEPAAVEDPPASLSTDVVPARGREAVSYEMEDDDEPAAEPFVAEPAVAAPARERHAELFDAEYERQLLRVELLRESARARIAAGTRSPSADGERRG